MISTFQDFVDWCGLNPCQNNGACVQVANAYKCSCAVGWTGMLCDVRMVSCEAAAALKGTPLVLLIMK